MSEIVFSRKSGPQSAGNVCYVILLTV